MEKSCSTTSLDYWRKFFTCANADIFEVIKYAILVASVDFPTELLCRRDQITEILYTFWPMQCSSDRNELQTPDSSVEDDESSEGTRKESKESNSGENERAINNEQSTSNRPEYSNLDEFEALTDEIEEEQQTVGEVLRIKGVLTNWKEESENVLSESLRRLQLMELSVETLGATDIGRVVNSLDKYKSKPIRQLAQTLVKGWKLLADEWVNAATFSQEPSPESVEPSPAEEESLLPSELDFPPLDMGALLATQTASFEFSKFFEGMDEDGNITSTGEFKKNGRTPQQKESNPVRKDNVEVRMQEVQMASKSTDATRKASKPKDIPNPPVPERPSQKATPPVLERPSTKGTTCRDTHQRQKSRDQSEEFRRQVVSRPQKPIDASRKTSKPQDIAGIQAPGRPSSRGTAYRNNQQTQKPSGVPSKPCLSRKDVSKESEELSYRYKLEATKRKLQDRYQEAKDAKRQRTIQVMDLKDLPKQGQNNQQQQPNAKRGSYFNRFVNRKSK